MKPYLLTFQKITLIFSLLISTFVFSQTTRLSNSICSKTISNLGVNITCNVNLGQGHRFEVSTPDGSVVGEYDGVAAAQFFPNRSRYLFNVSSI